MFIPKGFSSASANAEMELYRARQQTFTFSNSNSRILCMWRFDRLDAEDSLLDDDDEWLDDAIAIVCFKWFSLCFVNIVL